MSGRRLNLLACHLSPSRVRLGLLMISSVDATADCRCCQFTQIRAANHQSCLNIAPGNGSAMLSFVGLASTRIGRDEASITGSALALMRGTVFVARVEN